MPETPEARIIASVKGGKAIHERECPVCGERFTEKRTETKSKDGQGTTTIEASVSAENFEKHFAAKHGE